MAGMYSNYWHKKKQKQIGKSRCWPGLNSKRVS
jgi:hypothetical protein